ncbi:MAG: thiosulfate oxidation carrier protein SoxY [Alphaproteobacteria bacterium]|nr:thiosulfate oxidation carrier protein SoxY [Alphaproteobacteria bacterium]MBF0249251.1 thiosulfate oxidation carrier protein SoxY [Alphaproteobacteria bacterium]
MVRVDRREALKVAGASVLAIGFASTAHATPEDAVKYIGEKTGGAAATEGSAKVTIKLPEIAENGATVPITVVVDSPMTDADHVKHIHLVADGNPSPQIVSFNLTPGCGKAEVSTRIRLGKTQNVIAAAVMSDGSVHTNKQEVKVTIGGCGG